MGCGNLIYDIPVIAYLANMVAKLPPFSLNCAKHHLPDVAASVRIILSYLGHESQGLLPKIRFGIDWQHDHLTGPKIYSIGFYSNERFLGDLESSPNFVFNFERPHITYPISNPFPKHSLPAPCTSCCPSAFATESLRRNPTQCCRFLSARSSVAGVKH